MISMFMHDRVIRIPPKWSTGMMNILSYDSDWHVTRGWARNEVYQLSSHETNPTNRGRRTFVGHRARARNAPFCYRLWSDSLFALQKN